MKTTNNTETINALIDLADIAAERYDTPGKSGSLAKAWDYVAAAFLVADFGTEEIIDVQDCANAIVEIAYRNGFTRGEARRDFWRAVDAQRAA